VTVGAQFLEIDTDAKAGSAPPKQEAPAKVTYFSNQNIKLYLVGTSEGRSQGSSKASRSPITKQS